jgi:exosortase/archaeosortase family protein
MVSGVQTRLANLPLTPPVSRWSRCLQEPVLVAAAASFVLISLDFLLVPVLRNTTFLFATGLLLCLIAHRAWSDPVPPSSARVSVLPLAAFCLLHFLLIAAAITLLPEHLEYDSSVHGAWLAAGKFISVVPCAVWLSKGFITRLRRRFLPELIAAAVAILTYYPYRLFVGAWPVYSKVLGHTVHAVASLFVPGLGYEFGGNPTITGQALDVHILFGCSGLDSVRYFQLLFAFVLVLDWDRLRRWRTLAGYIAGLATIVVANAIRITAMAVIGNRISADLVVQYHLQAGWIYSTSVFLIFMFVSHRWLLARNGPAILSAQGLIAPSPSPQSSPLE